MGGAGLAAPFGAAVTVQSRLEAQAYGLPIAGLGGAGGVAAAWERAEVGVWRLLSVWASLWGLGRSVEGQNGRLSSPCWGREGGALLPRGTPRSVRPLVQHARAWVVVTGGGGRRWRPVALGHARGVVDCSG